MPLVSPSYDYPHRQGVRRCLVVRPKADDPKPPKDANEALMAGRNLQEFLDGEAPERIGNVRTFGSRAYKTLYEGHRAYLFASSRPMSRLFWKAVQRDARDPSLYCCCSSIGNCWHSQYARKSSCKLCCRATPVS